MLRAAERAAIPMVRDFGELEKLQVSRKGFKDFVTSSDKKAEKTLIYMLSKAKPEYSFITEESGRIDGEDKEFAWIIDPIDGTTNFMRGIPHFAINIALSENDEVKAALTYDPLRGISYYAEKSSGAFSERERLRVSGREIAHEAMCSIHSTRQDEEIIEDMGFIVRRTGAIAPDLAYFASGKYDAVIAKNVQIWDIASGELLAKESGGFIKVSQNESGSYNLMAASSSKLFQKLSERISI